MIVVLTTVPTSAEGENLARLIVEARLAACVQILPKIKSIYFWDGKVRNDFENLLLIKTLPEKFPELTELIKLNHRYDTPEIVALEVQDVEHRYLDWISDYLK
jgi:periplasmic divalent cation tolerance protein